MLIESVDGNTTQRFGPSAIRDEPAMFATKEKAYWAEAGRVIPGSTFFQDFHPGVDRSATFGTPIKAMEAGVVHFAGWKDNISGFQIEVQINDRAAFSINHLSAVRVRIGQHVAKGQIIGNVGTSGATTGPHTHEGVEILEVIDNIHRGILYDPALFLPGGRLANSDLIKPEEQYVRLNSGGVNLWRAGQGFDQKSDIYAVARNANGDRPAGIYRGGKRIASLQYRFRYVRPRDTRLGQMAIVTGLGQRLGIKRDHVHFI